jgi:hypothetical protein
LFKAVSNGSYRRLSIRKQSCLAAEGVAEKRIERFGVMAGAAQPIDLSRGVTVDPDKYAFERHV